MQDPMKIMGPSGPTARPEATERQTPKSLANKCLQLKWATSKSHPLSNPMSWGMPEDPAVRTFARITTGAPAIKMMAVMRPVLVYQASNQL